MSSVGVTVAGMVMTGELAPGILEPTAAALARELAQDIRLVGDVLADYGFLSADDPRFMTLMETQTFQRLMREAAREWNNADSTKKRLRLKAQASLEVALPDLHALMVNERARADDRVNAAKFFKSLAGMDETGAGGVNMDGGGFSITINIGDKKVSMQHAGVPKIVEPDGTLSGEQSQ